MSSSPMTKERVEALRSAITRANSRGSLAQVWSYTLSHSQLVLRIDCVDGAPLFLTLGGINRVAFQPRWHTISLSFTVEGNETILVDSAANFEARCGVILTGDPNSTEVQEIGR